MDYKIYKLHFSTAVHFGNGNLVDALNRLMADTLFSAICVEAAKESKEAVENVICLAKKGDLIISDAMPFIGDTLYIPKPTIHIETEKKGDSGVKKQFKKLKYIPLNKLSDYLNGVLNPTEENSRIKNLGTAEIRTLAAVGVKKDAEEGAKEEAEPFFVGAYKFAEGNGLYVIAGFNTKEAENIFEKYLAGVSYMGIGGKRSGGLGKFKFEKADFSNEKLTVKGGKENVYITLSLSMAKEEELGDVINEASYVLVKRSGFIYSPNYANGDRRKKDFYAFQSGSCFKKSFAGDLFDVAGSGKHRVYRYAKPLFLEVKA